MAELDREKQKDKQLDRLLDAMLNEYSAVEPRAGLESRVLSHIREANARRRSAWWTWRWIWAGAAALAVAAILIMLSSGPAARKQPAPVAKESSGGANVAAPPLAASTARPPAHHTRATPVARGPASRAVLAEVRQEVFPTPEPLSNQERMLLSYLSRTPRQELVAQSHSDPAPDEDLLEGREGLFNRNY